MLHEFLTSNRSDLIERCRLKVTRRSAPRVTNAELTHGIPLFLDQLIKTLEVEQTSEPTRSRKVSGAAARHELIPLRVSLIKSGSPHCSRRVPEGANLRYPMSTIALRSMSTPTCFSRPSETCATSARFSASRCRCLSRAPAQATSPLGSSRAPARCVMFYFGCGVIGTVIAGSLSNDSAATGDRRTPTSRACSLRIPGRSRCSPVSRRETRFCQRAPI
jgi:hypothetical protein